MIFDNHLRPHQEFLSSSTIFTASLFYWISYFFYDHSFYDFAYYIGKKKKIYAGKKSNIYLIIITYQPAEWSVYQPELREK